MAASIQSIRVHLVPALVPSEDLAGHTVLVIDLLRATTTICHALANGAQDVVPYIDVEEVHCAADQARGRGEQVVCGGERGGVRIDGFDLGNSPGEYTPAAVDGKRVLFTTTNGTKALHHAASAERIFVASLANLSATTSVVQLAEEVDILCAGSHGEITREDVIAAGAYVARLAENASVHMNDSALLSLDAWQAAAGDRQHAGSAMTKSIAESLALGTHGWQLKSLGYAGDLSVCAAVDSLNVVASFDARSGVIQRLPRDRG